MTLKEQLHTIIFEADTRLGKAFDIFLIFSIFASVVVIMLESVDAIRVEHAGILYFLEWFFTSLFAIEYVIRIWVTIRPSSYIFSFYGLIDLFSILPTFLNLVFPGTQYLVSIRFLRILRVFRVLKLVQFVSEASIMTKSLKQSLPKVSVFLLSVFIHVTIFGAIMYMVEGKENGFNNIPHSIYWAIVTLTTVGYGDITPQTVTGQTIAAIIMILGYGMIAVPTGIVTAQLTRNSLMRRNTMVCRSCSNSEHDDDAKFCKECGEELK
jgi:voltage-gated potassium channel